MDGSIFIGFVSKSFFFFFRLICEKQQYASTLSASFQTEMKTDWALIAGPERLGAEIHVY